MPLLAATTECLCLHLLPCYSRVELVHLNRGNGQMLNRGSIGIDGNPTTRTINDTDEFEQQLRSLMEALSVSHTLPVSVIVPSVYTRLFDKPEEIEQDEIDGLLINEAEKFVLFKKNDPKVAWYGSADPNRLLYSAYPSLELELMLGALSRLKLTVESVELNYTSLVKGLATTGIIEMELADQLPWGMLVINEGMFFLALMIGDQFAEVLEVPLSTGHLDQIQGVAEIQQDFEHFMGLRSIARLIVVNNTVTISSSLLVKQLGFTNNSIVIDQTSLTVASLGAEEAVYESTIESLGTALGKEVVLPSLQLLEAEKRDAVALGKLEGQAFKVLIGLNLLVLVLIGALWGVMGLYTMTRQFELNRIEALATQKKAPSLDEKTLRYGLFVKQAIQRNVALNDLVVTALGSAQSSVWFERLMVKVNNDADSTIQIEGGATSPEPVNQLLSQLSLTEFPGLKDRPLEISKIDFKQPASPEDTAHYGWALQTKVASVAAPAPAPGPPPKPGGAGGGPGGPSGGGH
jgi:hypothetical protein